VRCLTFLAYPLWHDDAACRDLDDVSAPSFFYEPSAVTTNAHKDSVSIGLELLVSPGLPCP